MKNILLLISFFIFGNVFLNGCSKNHKDQQPNGFTYKDNFYKAETFGIYNFLPTNNYDIQVRISTGQWNESTNKLEGEPITAINLRAVSFEKETLLGAGNYFHSNSAATPGSINGGSESFCFNGLNYDCEEIPNILETNNESFWFNGVKYCCEGRPNIKGGRLEVSKEGEEYILYYKLTLSNGETIEGYYKGELDYLISN